MDGLLLVIGWILAFAPLGFAVLGLIGITRNPRRSKADERFAWVALFFGAVLTVLAVTRLVLQIFTAGDVTFWLGIAFSILALIGLGVRTAGDLRKVGPNVPSSRETWGVVGWWALSAGGVLASAAWAYVVSPIIAAG